MPLPFSKSMDIKLVNLVKENPSIYNARHPKYLDFDTRELVWQKIGDTMGRPASLCKTRWVNIRDMMRRKIRHRQRNPSQRANHYKYKYEDELAFMLPHFKESVNTSREDYAEFLEVEASDVPSEVFIDNCMGFDETTDSKPVFGRRQDETNTSRDLLHDLNPADPLDVFLLTIGSTLKKLSPFYLNQAKSRIFQIVQDFELKQIVNKDNEAGSSDALDVNN